jgi:uncharacterized protein
VINSPATAYLKDIYTSFPEALAVLLPHSIAVAEMAKNIAENVGADSEFVYEAAILHDIGIYKTNAPSIGCYGDEPYMIHGVVGSKLLKSKIGFEQYARVCETHIGVSISKEEIINNSLPLPHRSMEPTTLEEEIVAYSDSFFSKSGQHLTTPKPFDLVLKKQKIHSLRGADILLKWHSRFSD